jgi:uncharacterized protein YciI
MSADNDARIAALLAPMAKLKLYVILSHGKGLDLRPLLADHLEYLIALEKDGRVFASGPLGPPASGDGMTIVRAADEAEARMIAENEPFIRDGIRDFSIASWTVMEGTMRFAVDFSDGTMRIS